MHLTPSELGQPSSSPGRQGEGLTRLGQDFARATQEAGILLDLAHVNREGFYDAYDAARPDTPLVVTHTGVRGVLDMWRNISDHQIRCVAERGGVVGIIYQPAFLTGRWKRTPLAAVVDHIEHVIEVAGEDLPALGSDFDGLILLPDELRDITDSPKLVQLMLDRGWSVARIHKILGGNWLRVLAEARSEAPHTKSS